jgi:hypothetical protein
MEDQVFVPKHEPETPGHSTERWDEAFRQYLPAGEEFPQEEQGDQYGQKFRGEKIAQRIFQETPKLLYNPAPALGFIGIVYVHKNT